MPPRTRMRGAKGLKENADIENKFKSKAKVSKPTRKALADKTNSLSDDNETVTETNKLSKLSLAIENNGRPRRQKRLPARFKENRVLKDLSSSLNNSTITTTEKSPETVEEASIKETSKEQDVESRKKPVNGIKEGVVKPALTKTLESTSPEKDVSVKDKKTSQNHKKILTSENLPISAKNTRSKKGNIVSSKIKTPDTHKKQIKSTKVTKPDVTETQKSNTSGLQDKSPNTSKTTEALQISATFTPPPNRDSGALEKSLVINRPKRIHRLPSRFDDHSISPHKFIPVQPCHASTPLQKKNVQSTIQTQTKQPGLADTNRNKENSNKSDKNSSNKTSPDSNNNPKSTRSARLKVPSKISPVKKSPKKVKTGRRLLDKSLSFKILDDKKRSKDSSEKSDVYEFTFDPEEEPQPQKKKKKRVVKKTSKPKAVTYKNNYDKNISKAMAALKDAVAKYVHPKDSDNKKETKAPNKQNATKQTQNINTNTQVPKQNDKHNNVQLDSHAKSEKTSTKITKTQENTNQMKTNFVAITDKPLESNGNRPTFKDPPSIRVEDIEADCEISYHNDINYSPVNSPRPSLFQPMAVTQNFSFEGREEITRGDLHNKDPLNLQDDISFFDDQPVASSSMNVSVRHPLASPWRVEFGSLPIKWQSNTYLKPNMTPAVENSFISSEDSNKRKHVYVNMVPQNNVSLPQIVEHNTSNLKQTSIISFIKEVAERNAKKKMGKSMSPMKASLLFEDITNKANSDSQKTPNKTSKKCINKAVVEETVYKNVSNSSSNTSNDKENIRVTRKRKNENAISKMPAKSPRKEKDKNVTYFGFDDSENQDQENIVPSKDTKRARVLRSRTRVLQEMNGQTEPARGVLPFSAKTKITSSSEAVKKIYEELKSAADAPQFMEKKGQQNAGTTNVDIPQNADNESDDGESVHLFEDIDVVHHLKPTRKSYGKAKKVTFRQRSTSDSETRDSDVDNDGHSSADDMGGFTFTMPEINEKKTVRRKKTKKMMTKKEEKEADEWAAGFNSMCEDIEEFPLVVE